MADVKDDGGPAYPSQQHIESDGCWNQTFERGISTRDRFALGVIQGRAAIPGMIDAALVQDAYRVADLMLEERKR